MENITIIAAIRLPRQIAGKAPIIIRVIVGRQVAKTFNTGIKVSPENWNPDSRAVKKAEINYQVYNMKLKQEIAKLENDFISKSIQGVRITKEKARKLRKVRH